MTTTTAEKIPDPANMKELLAEASRLAKREVEVEKTSDGKYIVLYLSFDKAPPPKGETPADALSSFIDMMLRRSEAEATMGSDEQSEESSDGNHAQPSRSDDQ